MLFRSADAGQYYRDYVALMDHWNTVLPGFILRVQHEDVVADLESEVRRMLDFCNLPFEEACLEFHKTERSVRTPSSEQVRQPIYTSGLQQWQHFEEWLGPLKESLGPEIRAGDKAPDFRVVDNALAPVTLADFRGKVKIVTEIGRAHV